MNKKAQTELDLLGKLAVGVAVLGITLIIAFLIIGKGQEQVQDEIIPTSVLNESFTMLNNTYVSLTYDDYLGISCSPVKNCTTGTAITGVTTTCAVTNGIKVLTTSTNKNNTAMCVDYTYTRPDSAYNATQDLQTATDSVPGWVPIFIIAMIGVVLLGIVQRYRR